jgi:RecA/RadA recombinase
VNQQKILESILAVRPGYRPVIPSLKDIAATLDPIEWVWDGWIPRGLITVLAASQGSGKSFVATDLAWRVIHDRGFPDGSPVKRPGANVIYVDAEMVPQILNERAGHYGLDRSKLFVMLPDPGEMIDLGREYYQKKLTEMAARLQPELIIIDSLSSVHTGGQNNVEDVRALLGYLIRLVSAAKCGLLLIHHIRKPPGGGQRMMNLDLGMEDVSGSSFITQQARVVISLRVTKTGPDFDPNGPREFKMIKTNLGLYRKPLGLSFMSLEPTGVKLDWQVEAPKVYREPSLLDECMEWLEDLLRANPEGIKPKEAETEGNVEGYSRTMVYRARKELRGKIQNTVGHKAPNNCWKWIDANENDSGEHEL